MWKRDRGGGRARAEARRDLMARSSSSGGMKKLGRATSGTPALEEAHINRIKVTPRLHTPHSTSVQCALYGMYIIRPKLCMEEGQKVKVDMRRQQILGLLC